MHSVLRRIFWRGSRVVYAIAIPLLAAASAFSQLGDRKDKEGDVQNENWKQIDVPRAPVLTPAEGLASLQIAPGFRVELVASEPLVQDPVAIVWATAKVVDTNTVEVWSDSVKKPVAVHYAWAHNPVSNLTSREGLPVTPFRTDNWPGVTVDKHK